MASKSKNNRDYGRSFYTDTTNDFSSGEYNVISTFASAPISYLNGTGLSGSLGTTTIRVKVEDGFLLTQNYYCNANGSFYNKKGINPSFTSGLEACFKICKFYY